MRKAALFLALTPGAIGKGATPTSTMRPHRTLLRVAMLTLLGVLGLQRHALATLAPQARDRMVVSGVVAPT